MSHSLIQIMVRQAILWVHTQGAVNRAGMRKRLEESGQGETNLQGEDARAGRQASERIAIEETKPIAGAVMQNRDGGAPRPVLIPLWTGMKSQDSLRTLRRGILEEIFPSR